MDQIGPSTPMTITLDGAHIPIGNIPIGTWAYIISYTTKFIIANKIIKSWESIKSSTKK